MKAHVGIHGNEIADFLAKKGSTLGEGPSNELLIPKVKQSNEINRYFNKKRIKAWKSYDQARQTGSQYQILKRVINSLQGSAMSLEY